MSRVKLFIVLGIFGFGLTFSIILFIGRHTSPLESSFSPIYEILGNPAKDLEIASGKILPIDELDEKEFGKILSDYYENYNDTNDVSYIYLNNLLVEFDSVLSKPFHYRIFVAPYYDPNAWAMPGGVMFVTEGLLHNLESEAQLISIIAHEIGHIELGHCFNGVKYELLGKKLEMDTVGQFVDYLHWMFIHHIFSKTQEAEADEFAFSFISKSVYNPSGVYESFEVLQKYYLDNYALDENDEPADIVRDYYRSHPPLTLRIEKYRSEADNWWRRHIDEMRYNGIQNLSERISFTVKAFPDEWIVAQEEIGG